jgi:hypothetical protein
MSTGLNTAEMEVIRLLQFPYDCASVVAAHEKVCHKLISGTHASTERSSFSSAVPQGQQPLDAVHSSQGEQSIVITPRASLGLSVAILCVGWSVHPWRDIVRRTPWMSVSRLARGDSFPSTQLAVAGGDFINPACCRGTWTAIKRSVDCRLACSAPSPRAAACCPVSGLLPRVSLPSVRREVVLRTLER